MVLNVAKHQQNENDSARLCFLVSAAFDQLEAGNGVCVPRGASCFFV